jgi:hypothetical protein
MEGTHVGASKTAELDLSGLIILVGVSIDTILGVLTPSLL